MIRILDKNLRPLCGYDDERDLCIESSSDFGDKKLTLEVDWQTIKDYAMVEGYIETKTDRYVIKEIKRTSESAATIIAQLDLEALEGKALTVFTSEERTVTDCLNVAFAGTGWTASSESTKKRTIRMVNTSALGILKQAIGTYRLEAKIDSIAKTLTLSERIGEDRGAYIVSDLNLKALTVSSTTYDFYTEIEPYGKDGLTIESVNDGVKFLTNYSYSSKSKRLIWKDERYTVPEDLMEDAEAKLAEMAAPYVSYASEVRDLAAMSAKYSVLDFHLGDTVILSDPVTGTREQQRIVGLKEYPKHPEDNTVTLANKTLTFSELASRYQDTADTVDNITTDNGTLDGSAVDSLDAEKLVNLEGQIIKSAHIKQLDADYISVSNRIDAVEGDFETLNADYGQFNELVTGDLYGETGIFNELYANNFDAVVARVGTLDTQYGNIKSLLAGNVATGGLSAITLNANNATIDSAFLKSLVSQHITATDILSGKINTSNILIGSDDGNFQIEGNTLTVTDDDGNVRVQLGKDQTGNYSLFVGNSHGTLIDETGVHENAIANGLIVDRMVAETGGTYNGISANKLNIQSVVGSINDVGGLQATSIYYDEGGQTLVQKFSTMEQTLSTASDDASAAKTAAQNASAQAQEAIRTISGISTLDAASLQLSNEAHSVHTDSDGANGDYTNCMTVASLYLGKTNVTADAAFYATPSANVTGTWNATTHTYQVTGMTGNDGYVDITAMYAYDAVVLTDRDGNVITDRTGVGLMARANGITLVKRFAISKAPDGQVGASYYIVPSAEVALRSPDGETITPASVAINAYRIVADISAPYTGLFKIYKSTDGRTYTEPEETAGYTATYTIPLDAVAVRIDLYDSTGTYLYARKTLAVVTDADALADELARAQEDVLSLKNRTTAVESGMNGFETRIQSAETELHGLSDGSYFSQVLRHNNDDGTVTARMVIYHAGRNVTETLSAGCFAWYKQVSTGEEYLGNGSEITINPDDYGYGQHLIGYFLIIKEAVLTDRTGLAITDRDGNVLLSSYMED